MTLLRLVSWQLVAYGARLRSSVEVTITLQFPIFWVPYVMAFAFALTTLVTLSHLLHPGESLLEP